MEFKPLAKKKTSILPNSLIEDRLPKLSGIEMEMGNPEQASLKKPRSGGAKTSTSETPLKIAWFFDTNDLKNFKFKDPIMKNSAQQEETKELQDNISTPIGKLGIS